MESLQSQLTLSGSDWGPGEAEALRPSELELEVSLALAERLVEREGWPDGAVYDLQFCAERFAVVYEGRVWSMPRLTKDEQTAALLEIVLDGLTDLVAAESPLQ